MTVPQFGLLISLIGNIGGASLQFVFPPLILMRLDKNVRCGARAPMGICGVAHLCCERSWAC